MSDNLRLLWVLAAPFVLGIFTLRGCGLRFGDDRLGFVAWIWPAGCLALGASLFLFVVCQVEPWLWWIAPLFAALATGLLAARVRGAPQAGELRVPRPRLHVGFLLLVLALAAWCLVHIVAGASRPLIDGDEGNIWSLKAKSLIVDYYRGEFAAAQQWNLHPDYPLLNPLLQAWVHSQFGQIEHFASRFLVQGCVLSLLLATAAALRARLSGLHAGLLLLLLPFSAKFEQMLFTAYADGMVALGMVLVVDGCLRWRVEKRAAWLWLAALGAAFATWSKNEATLYLLAAAFAVVVHMVVHRPARKGIVSTALLCIVPPLAVVVAQALWNRRFGLRSDLLGANPTGKTLTELVVQQFAERAPAIGERAASTMLLSPEPHAIFLVLLLAPLLWRRATFSSELLPFWIGLVAAVVGMHLVYVGSFLPLQFHLDTSYLRVLFQLVPAAMVWCAALAQAVLSGSDAVPRPADAPAAT